MATSLRRQLEALAAPQTERFARDGTKRASLLFEPSEAASYDYTDILTIGRDGLHDLERLTDDLTQFEEDLFGESSEGMERSVQNKEVNAKLDARIKQFLRLISPHIMLRPAWKALEWMVVRYHIHEYNIDDVMMCILPYHATTFFVRMVQILDLKVSETANGSPYRPANNFLFTVAVCVAWVRNNNCWQTLRIVSSFL